MFLRSLEIKNYRSLECVELDKLGKFNVLIGRNNSGKSSVFNALALLGNSMRGLKIEWDKTLTARDTNRSLELRLMFEPHSKERDQLISILADTTILADKLTEQRKWEIHNSPFFRQVEFSFVGSEADHEIWLNEVSLRVENNQWAVIQKAGQLREMDRRLTEVVQLCQVAGNVSGILDDAVTDIKTTSWKTNTGFTQTSLAQSLSNLDPATALILQVPWNYLSKAFFFSPFRHSEESPLDVQGSMKLSQNGANLAQVLHAIHNNNRSQFYDIEKFLHAALPEMGMLHTPIQSDTNKTEVTFRNTDNFEVRLHEMGGGVEQLLMIATVLFTTGDESTLFLEEPESHLHVGAQRFLIERLREGDRQIFTTTHSPTFINAIRSEGVYQVRLNKDRTTVSRRNDANSLSEVLDDIGSRNSDVLLSDAVLFVEGPSDQGVFEDWGEKLGLNLEEHNVTTVAMGGGSDAARGTRARSDILEGISRKAPVPHLFVLDRDERSHTEIVKLQESLGARIFLLERRELENYMLEPKALLAAISSKHSTDATIVEKVSATSEDEIRELIHLSAENLYDLVLIKRIRAELGGLKGGLLPRDAAAALSHKARDQDFPDLIRKDIEARVSRHLGALKIDEIVNRVRTELEAEWADSLRRVWIAPGEEIVAAVFQHFGSEYKKPHDTLRIAREMKRDDIPAEIGELFGRVIDLTNRAAIN